MSNAAVTPAAITEGAFRHCVRLLQELHHLFATGKDDSEEAEALRGQMDPLWYQMTEEERDRIGGLSEDLYILAEGGAKRVKMSSDENTKWIDEASTVLPAMFTGRNIDAALKFLRRPFPKDRPRYIIPFLQARCWERLGESDVALVFMQEAEHIDSRYAVCVLNLLERLGRTEDAAKCAERIIANPNSSGEELYQAAAALLRPARRMSSATARPVNQRLVSILERALGKFLTTPKERREIADGDRYIITMLGFCHERLGNVKIAVRLYTDGLARYPRDPGLWTFRGIALIDADLPNALNDFRRAVQLSSPLMWPYYFLAWDALQQGNYLDTLRLCNEALQRDSESKRETAHLYEWLGIALAESGQAMDWVLHNFDKAEELDPGNTRIRHNRAIAEARQNPALAGELRKSVPTGENGWMIDGRASSEEALQQAYLQTETPPDPSVALRHGLDRLATIVSVTFPPVRGWRRWATGK